jgi:hypothetical protein
MSSNRYIDDILVNDPVITYASAFGKLSLTQRGVLADIDRLGRTLSATLPSNHSLRPDKPPGLPSDAFNDVGRAFE